MPKTNLRVLVCGGRTYAWPPMMSQCVDDAECEARRRQAQRERGWLYTVLDRIHHLRTITCVIDGAARGADAVAHEWAVARGIPTERFPADWERYGKRAGMLRNATMLVKGRPDVVIAFPGGNGTAHMAAITREANVPVYEPGPPPDGFHAA